MGLIVFTSILVGVSHLRGQALTTVGAMDSMNTEPCIWREDQRWSVVD